MVIYEDPATYLLINKRTHDEADYIPRINVAPTLEKILAELSFTKILSVCPKVDIYHFPQKGGIYVSTITQTYEEGSIADGLILFVGLDPALKKELQQRVQLEFQEING